MENLHYVLYTIIGLLVITLILVIVLRKKDDSSYTAVNLQFIPSSNGVNLLKNSVTLTAYKVTKKGEKDLLLIPGIQPDGNTNGTNNMFMITGKTKLQSEQHHELNGYNITYLFGSVNDCGLMTYGSFIVQNGKLTFQPNAWNGNALAPRPFGSNCDPNKLSGGLPVGPNDSVIPLN